MRTKSTILFLIMFLAVAFAAQAAELASPGTPQRKLQRGLLNVAFSPLEISHALEEVKSQDKWFVTWFPAGLWGLVHAAIRATTGLYEIITFPIPSPPGYRPILKPELALEFLDSEKKE